MTDLLQVTNFLNMNNYRLEYYSKTINIIVEEAEKLTQYIDFERVVEFFKKQPLEGYVSKDSLRHLKKLDTQIIYDEKERWSKHFKTQLELLKNSRDSYAEIKRELYRIANFIIRNEESILSINGWFFNFPLLGDIWAEAEALKLYKNELLKIQNTKQFKWNEFVYILGKSLYLFMDWLRRFYENKRNRKYFYLILIGIGLLPFAIILIGELLKKIQ